MVQHFFMWILLVSNYSYPQEGGMVKIKALFWINLFTFEVSLEHD